MIQSLIVGVKNIGLANTLVVFAVLYIGWQLRGQSKVLARSDDTEKAMRDMLIAQVEDLTNRVRHLEDARLTDERVRGDRVVSVLERISRLWTMRQCLHGHAPDAETDALERVDTSHMPTPRSTGITTKEETTIL